MNWQEALARILKCIEDEPALEGAFLGGSLATREWDELSDIDLGIAARNTLEDLDRAFALRNRIAEAVGHPVHRLEKQWDHSRMLALLYGRSEYPPIGLELDLFFSQAKDVCELMPGASFGILFDHRGVLKEELDRLAPTARRSDIREELTQQLVAFPFDTNHAVKAHARGDLFNYQAALERMRTAVFSAAASRRGSQVRGSKRALQYLSAAEKELIQASYHEFARETVQQVVNLYMRILVQVEDEYDIRPEVEHLQAVLPQVS